MKNARRQKGFSCLKMDTQGFSLLIVSSPWQRWRCKSLETLVQGGGSQQAGKKVGEGVSNNDTFSPMRGQGGQQGVGSGLEQTEVELSGTQRTPSGQMCVHGAVLSSPGPWRPRRMNQSRPDRGQRLHYTCGHSVCTHGQTCVHGAVLSSPGPWRPRRGNQNRPDRGQRLHYTCGTHGQTCVHGAAPG